MLLFCCTNVRWPWRSLKAPINKCIVNRTVVNYIYYYWLIVCHNGTCLVLINFKWSLVCDHFELEPFWVGAGICSVKLLQIHLDLGLCYLENAVGLHGIHTLKQMNGEDDNFLHFSRFKLLIHPLIAASDGWICDDYKTS